MGTGVLQDLDLCGYLLSRSPYGMLQGSLRSNSLLKQNGCITMLFVPEQWRKVGEEKEGGREREKDGRCGQGEEEQDYSNSMTITLILNTHFFNK